MPREHLSMRKIKEILRLKWESKLADRQVANSCGVSRSTVSEYVRRALAAGLSWPLPDELDEDALAERLFPRARARAGQPPLPDWPDVQRELKRKGVTRWLLWSEYKDRYPDGLQYSQYCQRYRDWRATQSVFASRFSISSHR